jgi:uncharacterized protein
MPPHATFDQAAINQSILDFYPETQAIYLFGSYAAGEQRPQSDLDLAILLPATQAKAVGSLMLSPLHLAIEALTQRSVDCVNLRLATTVFQYEVVSTGRRIFCWHESSCNEYEALVLSLYQKLNEERAAIIAEIYASGRVYAP